MSNHSHVYKSSKSVKFEQNMSPTESPTKSETTYREALISESYQHLKIIEEKKRQALKAVKLCHLKGISSQVLVEAQKQVLCFSEEIVRTSTFIEQIKTNPNRSFLDEHDELSGKITLSGVRFNVDMSKIDPKRSNYFFLALRDTKDLLFFEVSDVVPYTNTEFLYFTNPISSNRVSDDFNMELEIYCHYHRVFQYLYQDKTRLRSKFYQNFKKYFENKAFDNLEHYVSNEN